MSATITCTPTGPTAITSACRIDVAGADANTSTGYNTANYPASPELRYYLKFTKGGTEYGRSYVFGVNPSDGTHTFNDYIFPSSGSWTITLANASSDATVQTQAVTVS